MPDTPPPFRTTTGETPHEPVTRPWELELLISGAVTFALLQLPGRLDTWFDLAMPRQDRVAGSLLVMLYFYGKLILYVLIVGFSVHLAARAYWVGLIGLEAVFPEGIRWDDTRYGPIAREVYRDRIGRLQPLIDRADRFCSMIFPASFSVVLLFLYSIVLVGTIGGTSWALSALLGGRYLGVLYYSLLAAWAGFGFAVNLADRKLGPRLDPDGWGYRLLRRVARVMYYLGGVALFGAVFSTLYSNLPRRVYVIVVNAVIGTLMMVVLVKDIVLRMDGSRSDGYAYIPDGGSTSVSASFYENLDIPTGIGAAPSISSDVVDGPYLRLFVPYVPRNLNPVIRERCRGVSRPRRGLMAPARSDTLPLRSQEALIGCLTAIQPVRLNGDTIRPVFRFYEHPRRRLRGMIAYIPTAQLPPGENVLEVGAIPRVAGDDRPARPPYRIPFWR